MSKSIAVQNDYVFDNSHELPTGELKLTVLRGDAWVFTEESNFIMRRGEQRILPAKSKPVTLRRAFTRGFAKYQVEVVA
jgi:hypothetical protein